MSFITPLHSWASSNGYTDGRGGALTRTHNIMDGGKLHIPPHRYDEFLEKLAEDITMKRKKWTLSELPSLPVFRLYFDLDLYDEEALPIETITGYMAVFQRVIRGYYPEDTDPDTFKAVVCTTTPTTAVKGDKEWVKSGIHVVYPNLDVTYDMVMQIRHQLVYELEQSCGKRACPSNDWRDAVDKAPYRTGMKMCGNYKVVPCPECKERKRSVTKEHVAEAKRLKKAAVDLRKKIKVQRPADADLGDFANLMDCEWGDSDLANAVCAYTEYTDQGVCGMCNGRQRVVEDRTYAPELVLGHDTVADEAALALLTEDTLEALRATSIRSTVDEATPGFSKPPHVPTFIDGKKAANLRTLGSKLNGDSNASIRWECSTEDIYAYDAEQLCSWKDKTEVHDPDVVDAIQDFIRKRMGSAYERVFVKGVFAISLTKSADRGGSSSTIKGIGGVTSKRDAGVKAIQDAFAKSGRVAVDRSAAGKPPPAKKARLKRLAVRVSGEGSSYCHNKGDDHTSNTVYFWFTPGYCCQRCFSKKEEIRPCGGVACGDYSGPEVALPPKLKNMLFEDDEEYDTTFANMNIHSAVALGAMRPPGSDVSWNGKRPATRKETEKSKKKLRSIGTWKARMNE